MFRRLRKIIKKEFIQALRDKKLRIFIFLPPIVQLLTYGYAVNFDIERAPTAILDEDRSAESRKLLYRFSHSRYFDIREYVDSERDLRRLIDHSRVTLALRIPRDFARQLQGGRQAPVQLLVDATDSNAALIVTRYAHAVVGEFSLDLMRQRLRQRGLQGDLSAPVVIEPRAWFNDNLVSRYTFVPGVIAMVVMLVSFMLTALAVVREKEIGTMEQILVSPLRPVEFMLGKTIPFVVIALLDVVLVTAVGVFWFEVPLRGSLVVLFVGTVAFLFNSVGLGLFISTVSNTQQQAMMAGSFIFTPAILLSGFIFPISNMPEFFQYITYLNPLRYFITVVQAVFLKGSGLAVLWPHMAAMTALGLALLTLSVSRFRRRLG
ncbi:MAG: ABC transporter permease [Deltaproteobacteria bacterium]|nr:ABC transporter permease [Deltaproteobacteria bacterium]